MKGKCRFCGNENLNSYAVGELALQNVELREQLKQKTFSNTAALEKLFNKQEDIITKLKLEKQIRSDYPELALRNVELREQLKQKTLRFNELLTKWEAKIRKQILKRENEEQKPTEIWPEGVIVVSTDRTAELNEVGYYWKWPRYMKQQPELTAHSLGDIFYAGYIYTKQILHFPPRPVRI